MKGNLDVKPRSLSLISKKKFQTPDREMLLIHSCWVDLGRQSLKMLAGSAASPWLSADGAVGTDKNQ